MSELWKYLRRFLIKNEKFNKKKSESLGLTGLKILKYYHDTYKEEENEIRTHLQT